MKHLLAAATIGLIALAMATSSTAAPVTPRLVALQRRVVWQDKRIRNLEQRRTYLHHYIRHLRNPMAVSQPSTSAPASSSYPASGGWANDLRAVGFPESVIPTMLYIINRESGGDPSAVNPSSGACGLTQIWPAQPGCLDPMTNLRMAFQKYQASGLAPWGM